MEPGKKTYEIAYALWRVADYTAESALADIFRKKAIEMIGFAADGQYGKLSAAADSLQMVVKFAVDTACISVDNAAILSREIGNLQSAIEPAKDTATRTGNGGIDISAMFSSPTKTKPAEPIAMAVTANTIEDYIPDISGTKAETRQSAILERIRQIGDCRMSDLQAVLPEVSERTLRYDLEYLVQRNLIERMGTGGRSVFYRVRI